MIVIRESAIDSDKLFYFNGLEYQKGQFIITYGNIEYDENGDLIKEDITVGLRHKRDFSIVLSSNRAVSSWSNGVTSFMSIDSLIEYMVGIIDLNVGGSSDGSSYEAQLTQYKTITDGYVVTKDDFYDDGVMLYYEGETDITIVVPTDTTLELSQTDNKHISFYSKNAGKIQASYIDDTNNEYVRTTTEGRIMTLGHNETNTWLPFGDIESYTPVPPVVELIPDASVLTASDPSITYSSDVWSFVNAPRFSTLSLLDLLTEGVNYRISFEVVNHVSGNIRATRPITSSNQSSNGVVTFDYVVGSSSTENDFQLSPNSDDPNTFDIINISCIEI